MLASGGRGGTASSDALQPETADDLPLASIEEDTDGLNAAAPYSGTSYEDEEAESLAEALPAMEQDPASDLNGPDGDSEVISSDAAQPQMEQDGSDSGSGEASMSEASGSQAEAPLPTETAADMPSRLNGTIIKRTDSSITFKF